jgi:hypothetical protein
MTDWRSGSARSPDRNHPECRSVERWSGTASWSNVASDSAAGPTHAPRYAYFAFLWCGAFAALHVYWAVGGGVGLASSAGVDLATRRPPLFVLAGLWGTALLLLLGAALTAALARGRPRGRLQRVAVLAVWLGGIVLLARGVVLQLVLMTGASGVAPSVGESEVHWSLILWNPWFMLGGILFLLTAYRLGRGRGPTPHQTHG